MKYFYLFIIIAGLTQSIRSQNIYFPPITGDDWETISPDSLGWCTDKIDSLYDFLDQKNTKAFILLKDGKIVLEHYFDSFVRDSIWYWASAGKTLTAFLTGIAQEEGYLSISDSTSKYLGSGWTSCPPEKEKLITIWNQLTMTSGLKDYVADPYCTDPECLLYQSDAGTRWAYHNAPYTLLDKVIENATSQNFNIYFNNKIRSKIGMNGLWIPSGYNNVYFSTPRSMARFGILIQNKGIWNSDTLLHDPDYFNAMVNTSQNLNQSYGYLWWLAGKETYMLPSTQFVFPGTWAPAAPTDMIAALGKNGQTLNIIPSMGLVLVRMGEAPDSSNEVAVTLNNEIWEKLNPVICASVNAEDQKIANYDFRLEQNYPNPFNPLTSIQYTIGSRQFVTLKVYDLLGKEVATLVNEEKPSGIYNVQITMIKQPAGKQGFSSGIYFYKLQAGEFVQTKKMMFLK